MLTADGQQHPLERLTHLPPPTPVRRPGAGRGLQVLPVRPSLLPGHVVMTSALSARSESEHVVDMAFLGTRAGLLRSSLFVGSEKVSDK